MIKTCYLLKEKLTNVVYKSGCKMIQINDGTLFSGLWNY
jgi:hypothetical protein